jgi:hypothetical protein
VTTALYDSSLLEEDQRRLLDLMVQADNAVAKPQRTSFVLVQTDSDAFLLREGFPRDPVAVADLSILVDRRLVHAHREASSNLLYDLTPEGRRYWTEMKQRIGSEIKSVEAEIRTFIDSAPFITSFPEAHDRWTQAAAELWRDDFAARSTDIGPRCREAMQFFTTALIQHAAIPVDESLSDPPRPLIEFERRLLRRTTSVTLTVRSSVRSCTTGGTVSDLVQRQEHGAEKQGPELTWEDARRVVFQTAIAMYEVSRAFGR